MIKSPKVYPHCIAIIVQLLLGYDEQLGGIRKIEIIKKIYTKINSIANTCYLEIWLQRLTMMTEEEFVFSNKLSNKLEDSSINIWNSGWLDLDSEIDEGLIIQDEIKNISEMLSEEEISLYFNGDFYY